MNRINVLLFVLIVGFSSNLFAQNLGIAIDPGHGGRDPGNLSSSRKAVDEKHLNLEIALLLGEFLTENMKNVTVIYTRTTDKFVSLDDRVYIANNKKVDYFISIHANSNKQEHINGCRVHIHNGNFGESKNLAKKITAQMSSIAGRKALAVQDSRQRGSHYFVLENTAMPAVLVECGFMTNFEEEVFLNSAKGKKMIALAIYKGVESFVNNLSPVVKKTKLLTNKKNLNIYRVQIKASTQVIPSYKFKKLNMPVEEIIYTEGVFKYKYFVGSGSDFSNAKKIRNIVITKGFKDAFIVKK